MTKFWWVEAADDENSARAKQMIQQASSLQRGYIFFEDLFNLEELLLHIS